MNGHPVTAGPVWTGRLPANAVPATIYALPARDKLLPADVQELLRAHPAQYTLLNPTTGARERDGAYNRCPTCEQWTAPAGCDVRELAEAGDLPAAREMHAAREWPATLSARARERFRGMSVDYSRVQYVYFDIDVRGS